MQLQLSVDSMTLIVKRFAPVRQMRELNNEIFSVVTHTGFNVTCICEIHAFLSSIEIF